MSWQPVDLATACPVNTHLSACSYFGYIYLNVVAHLYGDSMDRRIQEKLKQDGSEYDAERTVEKTKVYNDEYDEYDFIIVGAGSAGCVLASRLSEISNWTVLLLEAGGEQPDVTLVPALDTALGSSNIDWQYVTQSNGKSCLAYPNGQCTWPRGKTMGGTSSINTMAYVRGNKADFDGWAEMGNVGWSYEDVLPFFRKSERNLNLEGHDQKYHGYTGEQYVTRFPFTDTATVATVAAFHELGLPILDFNGAHQEGTMVSQATSRNGMRVSTNNAFIQPIRYIRKNLIIRPNSEATKILIDEHKRAFGVKYMRDGVEHIATVRKEIIISGGSINSPKLLLLSGIGPRKHLEECNIKCVQDLAVGENLQDHPTFIGIVVAMPNETNTLISNEEILNQLYEYKKLKVKKGPLSHNGPVPSVTFYRTNPNLIAPDIQYQCYSGIWQEIVREPVNFLGLGIFPSTLYNAFMPRVMLLVPKSRGRLILNHTDPNGAPLIYPNYLDEEEDIQTLLAGTHYALKLEHTKAFKSIGAQFVKIPLPACRHLKWGTNEYWVCTMKHYTSSTYHPAGSCKMGPEWDENAVVDPRLRVYGIKGLRVIDASIMPVLIRGNTNAPSIMIGEKGSTLIKEDWGVTSELYFSVQPNYLLQSQSV